jgi:hypothetical protein
MLVEREGKRFHAPTCAHEHGTLLDGKGVHFTFNTTIAPLPEKFGPIQGDL